MALTKVKFSKRADVAKMAASSFKNESRVELNNGDRYEISASDLGLGVLLASGNYANKLNKQWVNKSDNFNILPGKEYLIDASGGAVDAVLATSYVVGDNIIVHNESISTNLVRLTNTALTIKGPGGTVTSSDNLVLEAGDTVNLVAKTTTILEVV